jgi:1-acyl-sn-glycerol-3-phosphate acyltransferase
VIYLNHPSWWDPLVGLTIARQLLVDRRHYAVIDAVAFERYAFFRKLGFYGVEQGTRSGARTFLETSMRVLDVDRSTLWMTPEGRFCDPREPLPELAPGLGHLARRMKRGQIVPLALEYPFWEERLPEALALFGEPIPAVELAGRPRALVAERLSAALEEARERLTKESLRRDPERFETLVGGDEGVGGPYDWWKSVSARLRGESFEKAHAAVVRKSRLSARQGGRRA